MREQLMHASRNKRVGLQALAALARHAFKPLVRDMAHNPDALKTSPEQYLERAKIIRRQVETMNNADVRRHLLDIAEKYEELADGIERPQSL
jgi:thermostable 8-oxoguanine DNA glycosylase